MKPFVVVVSNHVKPGCEGEYLKLVLPIIDEMRHEASFINNIIHRATNDPTRFMIYETWADREDVFNVQIRPDYRKTYEARLPEMLRTPREMTFWDPVRSDFAFFTRSTDDTQQIPLVVSLEIKPDCEAEYLKLVEPVFDAMRHEPGFINASLARDPDNPAKFLIYETWSDKCDLLEVQMKRDYRKPFLDRLGDMVTAPPQLEFWEHLRGDFTFFSRHA